MTFIEDSLESLRRAEEIGSERLISIAKKNFDSIKKGFLKSFQISSKKFGNGNHLVIGRFFALSFTTWSNGFLINFSLFIEIYLTLLDPFLSAVLGAATCHAV